MFSNFFFIFLVLALINFVPELPTSIWIPSSKLAFIIGLISYGIFLGFIYLQIRFSRKFISINAQRMIFLINLECLAFLCLYHFGLGAHRFLLEGPLLNHLQSPFSFFSLLLYIIALGWSHYWLADFNFVRIYTNALNYAYKQLQFLFPFCVPFILFSLLFDGLSFIPQWEIFLQQSKNSILYTLILFGLSLLLLFTLLILMPPLIITCWQCQPLINPHLTSRLQQVCNQAGFKHGGFKTWTVLRYSFTAGIVGVLPRFRYIIFTPNLIDEFSPEEIEAILIHEIGHSHYKHLIFYPFILLGMLIIAAFLSFFYIDALSYYFHLQDSLYSSETGGFVFSVSIFLLYGFVLALYFRLIFGFFSRLFERQADLHIFDFPLSPTYMIQALDHIAVVTGNTHLQPSWHHYSIQERINFLQSAIQNPQLIIQHHHKVKKWLMIYFFLLALNCLILFLLFK